MRTRIRTKSGSTAILQPVKLLKKNLEEDEIVCGDRIIGDKVVQVEPSSSFSSDDTTVVTPSYSTRRNVLATMSSTSAAAILFSSISPAVAGVAEVDKSTGSLYTPKKVMLSGGSSAARGIKINTKDDAAAAKPERLKPGQQIQNVYETRFVAYLSRFLINYDEAANSFWKTSTADVTKSTSDLKFAEFSESVEIGLADYFVGPYGSYSSLGAMKAGINAKYQAKSKRYDDDNKSGKREGKNDSEGKNILEKLALSRKEKKLEKIRKETEDRKRAEKRDKVAKQGVLNLYTLLKARYTSRSAKRQLAILFSFISNPAIQPTAEIRSLLGEMDNASITDIELTKLFARNIFTSRSSSRRGGGYSYSEPPIVSIECPPALGSAYKCAKLNPIMERTSRILRINLLDGGEGYTKPPDIYIPMGSGGSSSRQCVAQAIIDRKGHIESVVVLDPGYGYGQSKNGTPPAIIIKPPESKGTEGSKNSQVPLRQATAEAELEYAISEIEVIEGGNGYVATDPPKVFITSSKEDPDWYVDYAEIAVMSDSSSDIRPFEAVVSKMRGPKGNLAYNINGVQPTSTLSGSQGGTNPVALLPSTIRPELNSSGAYVIPFVSRIRTYDDVKDNPRFRAVDPLFGAIGALPTQKSAAELKPNEYGRLALSGAICTILVRTALNPLELIKTKLQLENDEELLSYAKESITTPTTITTPTPDAPKTPPSQTLIKSENGNDTKEMYSDDVVGESNNVAIASKSKIPVHPVAVNNTDDIHLEEETTVVLSAPDLIGSLIDLRGPAALFQSADITLLASLVFGSLGFGANELFRRSFTEAFFNQGGGGGGSSTTLITLFAAAVATIITCAVAAPFELLRVRSMGLVEPQKWNDVMKDFLEEKLTKNNNGDDDDMADFDMKTLDLKDYTPLWAGFGPTTSRELAFGIPKFLVFDIVAKAFTGLINSQMGQGALPIQVGVGGAGLAISAISGAFAGIVGALVSHPADLILTRLSASKPGEAEDDSESTTSTSSSSEPDWKDILDELLSKDGGVANLFVGLAPRLVFFFLVIGLQFFLYDYVKNLLQVGSDDLSLVLDVFYAVRQGLIDPSIRQGLIDPQ